MLSSSIQFTGAWGMNFVSSSPPFCLLLPRFSKFSYKLFLFKKFHKDYENFEKGMIYMKILKKGGSREKGGGGNEIHAPCACDSI
jgi:hypothetical protein